MKFLSVIYRACNLEVTVKKLRNSSRPDWFDKKRCWDSFFKGFGERSDVEIIVVFDGKKDEELSTYINQHKIDEIQYLDCKSNKESLIHCYNKAGESDSEYIYFAEDDYLYRDGACSILIEGLKSFGSQDQFVTLYDHFNRYLPPKQTGDVTMGHDYCLITESIHWRSGDSTTGTVALKKDFFSQIKNKFLEHNVHDCAFYREMLEKGHRVFNCVPGKSTHVNKFFSSPLIDWEGVNNHA